MNKLLKALALALACTVLGVFIYGISWLLATHPHSYVVNSF